LIFDDDQARINISPYTAILRKSVFEELINKNKYVDFTSLFNTYNFFCEKMIDDYTENLFYLEEGFKFSESGLTTETGEPITEYTSDVIILKALRKLLYNNKHILDSLLLEYTDKIVKNESIPVNDVYNMFKKIEDGMEKINKRNEITLPDINTKLPDNIKNKLTKFQADYMRFISDLPCLIYYEYVVIDDDKLKWNKDIAALNQYIKYIKPDNLANNNWALFRELFDQKETLRTAHNQDYGDSKDFITLKELLKNNRSVT